MTTTIFDKDTFDEDMIFNSGIEWVGKYNEKNRISRFLVDNFFANIETLIEHLSLSEHARILEVGCGAGISSLRIQKFLQGKSFEVSDVDEDVLRLFQKIHFPIPYRKEDVLQMERGDNEFDLIFLLEALEHISDYERALSEIFRVSKKYVIISTPNEPLWRLLNVLRGKYLSDLGNTPGHINHWSSRHLVDLLSRFGKVLDVRKPIPWTMVLVEKSGNGY